MQSDFQLISRSLANPRIPPSPVVEKESEQMNLFS
jgi:hypothetical protein